MNYRVARIQAENYNGKSPKEVEQSLYFDLPQLPEDNIFFIMLLASRYSYYLDAGNLEEANKIAKRIESLEEYIPKAYRVEINLISLYNACAVELSEEKADDLMDGLEKVLNSTFDATSLRIKMAYILYVLKDKVEAERFYSQAIAEAENCTIKGIGIFEKNLIERMKNDI